MNRYIENGRFKNKFDILSTVGQGGFGTVFKARYLLDNNIYAIKKVKLHLGDKETLTDHKVFREIQAITMLDPKNIIRYYTCWIEELDEEEDRLEKMMVQKFTKMNEQQAAQRAKNGLDKKKERRPKPIIDESMMSSIS